MPATPNILSNLISVEKQKFSSIHSKVLLFPTVFAFLNMLLCGFFDRYLQNDHDGYYLQLFLFIQTAIGVLFAVGFFKQGAEEILSRTQIFPVSSWDRFLYIIISNLRQPLNIVWISTTTLFFWVFYRHERMTALAATVFFLLLLLTIDSMIAVAILLMKKGFRYVTSLSLVIFLLGFFILVGTIVFNFHSILQEVPVVSWTAHGILAVQKSNLMRAGFNLFLILLVMSFSVITVRKFT
jgi:hypothetical protein